MMFSSHVEFGPVHKVHEFGHHKTNVTIGPHPTVHGSELRPVLPGMVVKHW